MMKTGKLLEQGSLAGFKTEQMQFLLEHFSLKPHTHTADQILDFDQAVTEIVEDTGVEDDEEDD